MGTGEKECIDCAHVSLLPQWENPIDYLLFGQEAFSLFSVVPEVFSSHRGLHQNA